MLFLLLAEYSFAFHAGQLRTSRQPRLPAIHSCAAPPPKPPPKPPQPVETPVAASPSGQPSGAAEKEKAYSSDWSGAGRFADDDPLPLSFWLFGPNPRRAILPTLLIWGMIAPATNLWGSGSFLLSLAPEASRSQRLDTFYPVSERRFFPYDKGYLDYSPGFKRFYDDQARFEFRYPATYVRDQAVYLRQADAAYTRRMLATTGLSGGAQPRRPSGPEVAFGPDSSSGTSARDENLSVVVGSAGPGFTLQRLGSPSEAAELAQKWPPPCLTTPPHRPASWWLQALRPLLRTLERSLGSLRACRGRSMPPPSRPKGEDEPRALTHRRRRSGCSRTPSASRRSSRRRSCSARRSDAPRAPARRSTSSSTASTTWTRSSHPRTRSASWAPARDSSSPSPRACPPPSGPSAKRICARQRRASSCIESQRFGRHLLHRHPHRTPYKCQP